MLSSAVCVLKIHCICAKIQCKMRWERRRVFSPGSTFWLLQCASCCVSWPTDANTNTANYRVLSGPIGSYRVWVLLYGGGGQPNQMLMWLPEKVTSGKNESGALVGTRILLGNAVWFSWDKPCCPHFTEKQKGVYHVAICAFGPVRRWSILGAFQFHRMHLTEMSENGNMVQHSMV